MTADGFFIALEVDGDGAHPAAWRFAAHAPDELISPQRTAATIRDAERHGFSAVTIDDGLLPPQPEPGVTARLDAVLRAAFAAPLTSGIGLAPLAHTAFAEPFHLSGQLSSLDHASLGRAGWLVASSGTAEEGAAYGRPAIEETQRLAGESGDVLRAARLLWDSWQDDAVIRDAETGRYLDRERIHHVDFEGPSFSVRASSITPRPPQGQVVVFAAADALPPELVDVALVTGADQGTIRREAGRVRALGVPRVVAEVEIVLAVQGVAAHDRLTELDAAAVWDAASGRLRFVGTADEAVSLLAELSEIVDGVRLHPAVLDVDGEELGRAVLPALRRRDLLRSPAPGQTLRETLGLPRPDNLFATGAAEELRRAAGRPGPSDTRESVAGRDETGESVA